MLSITEKQKIEDEIKKFPQKSAACIEALKIVQEERRWVPDDAVTDIAGILEMTPSEVDSVATFYNQIYRKPVGKHIILLCDSISCVNVYAARVSTTMTTSTMTSTMPSSWCATASVAM